MNEIETSFIRSNLIESVHKIKLLVKDKNRKVLLSTGNDSDYIYPRSSIKIFQAIPFVTSNANNEFKLSPKILALACSSHRGEDYHIKELKKWIDKIKLKEKILQCGIHYPLNNNAKENILRLNKRLNQLYNNCAGKHLAMVSSCLLNKYNTNNYLSFKHPHQIKIRKIFEKFSETKIKPLSYGIDGCSAPQYSFRINDLSNMLNNLTKSYKNEFEYNKETNLLIKSITKHPKYIGGTDSLDSIIMTISKEKIFCKGGAEGVFIFSDLNKEITGIIKVVDGNERAIPSVIYNLFKKYKIMNLYELKKLKKFYNFQLINHAKINIGSIKTKI